jgi:arylsulfatase A-like enzyme
MNVVFIVLDTVRKDRLSVYNEDVEFTQNLEEFAEDSLVFQDAVSQAPWTLPSHASMFTGQYPWDHGATQKKLYLDTDRELLAEQFAAKGYDTACYTSNTWISPYTGMAEGFQDIDNFFGPLPSDMFPAGMQKAWRWLNHGKGEKIKNAIMKLGEYFHWASESENQSKTPRAVNRAERFLDSSGEDFFLFLNFMDAHLPYYPPEEYRKRHAPDVDPSEVCQKAFDHNGGRVEADFEASRKLYDAEIDYLDDQLGRLFEIFSEKDLMEETAFVIVGDHGENLGEDDMFGHQFSVSEQLVSVPMMIRSPEVEPGEEENQVELRDLYDIVPWLAGFDDRPDLGKTFALGGYEYPKLDLKNIPEERKDELGKQLRFVRGKGKKAVRTGEEDSMIDLESGEDIEVEDEFVEKLDMIGEAEEGQLVQDQDEHVKERLEDLGYI